jgi:hypothetical protein
MALPTRDDALTLDLSMDGSPWVRVAAKAGIDSTTLDLSFDGSPWTGLGITGGTTPTPPPPSFSFGSSNVMIY